MLLSLPIDCLYRILLNLNNNDLHNMLVINLKLNNIIKSSEFWKIKTNKDFGTSTQDFLEGKLNDIDKYNIEFILYNHQNINKYLIESCHKGDFLKVEYIITNKKFVHYSLNSIINELFDSHLVHYHYDTALYLSRYVDKKRLYERLLFMLFDDPSEKIAYFYIDIFGINDQSYCRYKNTIIHTLLKGIALLCCSIMMENIADNLNEVVNITTKLIYHPDFDPNRINITRSNPLNALIKWLPFCYCKSNLINQYQDYLYIIISALRSRSNDLKYEHYETLREKGYTKLLELI